jgi:hypothetical protein
MRGGRRRRVVNQKQEIPGEFLADQEGEKDYIENKKAEKEHTIVSCPDYGGFTPKNGIKPKPEVATLAPDNVNKQGEGRNCQIQLINIIGTGSVTIYSQEQCH